MVASCGKKSENDDPTSVSTTPPVTVEDEPAPIVSNDNFMVSADSDEVIEGNPLILTIKNIGKSNLDYSLFKFEAAPSEALVSNLNCFSNMKPEDECVYSVMFENPRTKHHKIYITYDERNTNIKVEMNIKVIISEEEPEIHFLYRKDHTFADCEKVFKWNATGKVKSINHEDYCGVRGEHWNAPREIEIASDPLKNFNDPKVDASDFYCKANWTIHSFQFEEAEVEEVKNIFGGKRKVVIPPGESREVCVKRGILDIFKCKHKKVFYSRLVSVNCY